jgi:hypothetical protein
MLGTLIGSLQGKVALGVGLSAVVLSQVLSFNIFSLIASILGVCAVAFNATCLITGGCQTWSWIAIALPVTLMLLYIGINLQKPAQPQQA